jgi:hypothetical protein
MQLPNSVIEAMLCLSDILELGLTKIQQRIIAAYIRLEFGMYLNREIISDEEIRKNPKVTYTTLWKATEFMNKSNFAKGIVDLTNKGVLIKSFDKTYELNMERFFPAESERRIAINTLRSKRGAFKRENKHLFNVLRDENLNKRAISDAE